MWFFFYSFHGICSSAWVRTTDAWQPWEYTDMTLQDFGATSVIDGVFSSVQFSRSVMSYSLWPHESQHARPPCPLSTPRVHSDSRRSSQWRHPTISSSVVPFSSCPQFLPASESCPMTQLFPWGDQSTGVSASASVLPKNTQDWSLLGWTGLIFLQSKGLSKSLLQHHSSKPSILQHSAFSTVQISYPYMTTGKTIALTRQTFVGKVMPLLFNMLSSLVVTFLPRSSVQSLSRVWLFATPWNTARQASLSITNSRSLPKLMSIESLMPSSHLILCCPLLLLPTIRPSIRVFSNESQVYSITSEDFSIKKQKHWYRVCLSYDKRQLVWGYNNQIALSINKIYRPHLYF